MKTNSFLAIVVFSTALLATSAVAQTASSTVNPTAAPTSEISPTSPMPAPNSTIYVSRLPTPAELSSVAAAQGLSIAKMEQTSDHITVVYQQANGPTNTIAYRLLSSPGVTVPSAAPVPPPPTVVIPATTTTTVVYPRPVYYYDGPYCDPWAWGPPISLSFGFGYHYWHGDYDHFRGRRFHGGWHGYHHR